MSEPNPTSLPRLWDDLSLRPYLGEIRRRHGIVEILALPSMRDLPPMRIETLFVPPLLAESPVSADSDPKQWPQGQSLFAVLEQNPRLVVLGDPGSGKTTLANWLAWRLSAGLTAPLPKVLEDRVPLLCVLREMKADIFAATTALPELAESVARRLLGDKVDAALLASLRQHVAAGSYVLILDGVDEIPVSHRKAVAGWVRQAAAQQACVLATSRMVGYEDGPVDREETVFLGDMDSHKGLLRKLKDMADKGSLDKLGHMADDILAGAAKAMEEKPAWARRCYLMSFDADRIAAFVENWYRQRSSTEHEAREKTADLLAALNRSEVTQRLARTPNLLALMAIVHRERAHLPDGKALLYDEIANAYINTIDSQRKIEPGDALAPFGWKERKAWLARVGFEMQRRRSEETEEANRDVGVLASEADVLAWLTDVMRASGVAQPEQTAGAYLGWVARRSGLLLPRGEGFHAFVHLSFQEYFCACFLADRIVSPVFVRKGESSDGSVKEDLLRQWGGEPVWRETLVFLFELLSAERDTDWMDSLMKILFGSEPDTELDRNRATLAARALADRHVRLKQDRQEQLANVCCIWAMTDWNKKGYLPKLKLEVLPVLLEAGYAAIVAGPDDGRCESRDVREEEDFRLPTRKIADLEEIRHEVQLRVLIVTGGGITDISPLAELTALQGLALVGTEISDIKPLAQLTALRSLDLDGTQVSDIRPLAGLTALQGLSLDGTSVVNLSPLVGLTALKILSLNDTSVVDLTPLVGLTTLKALALINTGVVDVTPLARLVNLQWLFLDRTRVADLTPLTKLTTLQVLSLGNTPIADVMPLAGLPNLTIAIDGTTIHSTALKKN